MVLFLQTILVHVQLTMPLLVWVQPMMHLLPVQLLRFRVKKRSFAVLLMILSLLTLAAYLMWAISGRKAILLMRQKTGLHDLMCIPLLSKRTNKKNSTVTFEIIWAQFIMPLMGKKLM